MIYIHMYKFMINLHIYNSYIKINFFNHLRVSYRHFGTLPQVFACAFLKNRAIISHNHGSDINFGTFNIDMITFCLIYYSYTNFAS